MKKRMAFLLLICATTFGLLYSCAGESGKNGGRDPAFGTAINLGAVNSGSWDNKPCATGEELALYFHSNRPGGRGAYDVWMSTRKTVHDPWEEPGNVGSPVNSEYEDFAVCVTPDNLNLYFSSDRPGGFGEYDIWLSTRRSVNENWNEPVNLGPMINSEYCEMGPAISPDGLELYFSDYSYSAPRPGTFGQEDIWVATRANAAARWEKAENIGPEINSGWLDFNPSLSRDGRLLFFVSQRDDNPGNKDIWYSCRDSSTKEWKKPRNLGASVNSTANDIGAWLSKDEKTLWFGSNRPGGAGLFDLWMVSVDGKLHY
jgi:Tol biopolymer transport system component